MRRRNRYDNKKYQMSLFVIIGAVVILSVGITLIALWCQPNYFGEVLGIFIQKPVLFVLNLLPVALLLSALTCLFQNPFFAGSLVNLIVCGLSIANRIKIEVRDEPVFPRDLGLLKEVGSAMGSYQINIPVRVIIVVGLLSLLLFGLGMLVRYKPDSGSRTRKKRKILRNWQGSLVGTLFFLGMLILSIVTVLGSDNIYQSIGASNPYRLSVLFNEMGFPYSFCHQFTKYLIDKPENFNKSEAESWETGEQSGLGKQVHIIMVMNEAFSDITDNPVFTYNQDDPEDDPLSNLHALRQNPHTISGHIIVPGFAGGTANTEFDVLTGMQTNALSDTTTSAMRVVNRNLDSLFRVLNADHYHTMFLHPGDDWFYNRENVYHWLGAQETCFIDEMENPEYKGRWVTDNYVADLIEKKFQEAQENQQALFCYTTTIQNHMSYTLDKYGEGYEFPPLKIDLDLSEQAQELLQVYIEGARDADAMLGHLWRFFSDTNEPVILAFYGDHLPYLGDNQLAYRELGIDVDGLYGYATPYILWANNTAAEVLDWGQAVENLGLPEDGQLSASFFGAAILELTGRSGETPWFDFLNRVRRIAPIVQREDYFGIDGKLLDAQDQYLENLIHQWRCWSYYKLKYKEIP